MSQITYRANLSATTFPFISENFGRSVIVPQYDNTFNRQVQSAEDTDKDIGIPQIYYCHNVMPHPQGFQSVGYVTNLGGIVGLPAPFIMIDIVRDSGDNKAFCGITQDGRFYISTGGTWVIKTILSIPGLITFAYVSGTTYIYLQGNGCIKYNFTTGLFETVILGGLSISGAGATIGICPSAGYLIAWNATAVAWSSTTDPTDFVPSLISGAGGGSVEGAKGAITICAPLLLGFIVYTTANAVASVYSGNARFPYNFRELVNSGGVANLSLIAIGANQGNHYAYTTSGLQTISTTQAQTIQPEVTDFIAGKLFEDFDESTNTFTTTVLTQTMVKMVNIISDRYLLISYGMTSLTHCLVYDLVQKRFGKLRIPHVDTFEYELANPGITEIPRQSIGFLQADGTLQTVDFSVSNIAANGVLLLGKYQFVRPRLLQMDEIALENVRVLTTNFSLTDMYTLDGKTYLYASPTLDLTSGLFKRYKCRIVGLNHTLLFKGAWELCSLVLTFNIHGKR